MLTSFSSTRVNDCGRQRDKAFSLPISCCGFLRHCTLTMVTSFTAAQAPSRRYPSSICPSPTVSARGLMCIRNKTGAKEGSSGSVPRAMGPWIQQCSALQSDWVPCSLEGLCLPAPPPGLPLPPALQSAYAQPLHSSCCRSRGQQLSAPGQDSLLPDHGHPSEGRTPG